jgi:hypothetical protein
MLKPFVAIATAATIADVTPACRQQPWPYLNCTGTDFGNRNFRLIAIDRHTR